MPVPAIRLRTLNDAHLRSGGRYVLYWMTATRRLGWNYALDHAMEQARLLQRPLLVFEAIDVDYPWASARHHLAILDGMAEHGARLSGTGVGYYPYVEPRPGAGRGLLQALAAEACLVVTDDAPVFFTPRLVAAAAKLSGCRADAVDSCGLLPLAAPDASFGAAYHFRRFLHRSLLEHLLNPPTPDPLAEGGLTPLTELPGSVTERWPARTDLLLGTEGIHGAPRDTDALRALPIDHSVGATGWRGGSATGRARLTDFLASALDRYADERNHPDADVASGLSPWLHYGQLSSHEVFDAVARHEGWSPARIDPPNDGRRAGWWGMSPGAEAFVDQLVTWRELGYVYCARHPDHDRYGSLPRWALDTLEQHASDERPHLYTLEQMDAAETDDPLWNAAQRQLRHEGVVHNYLRMLWGKKILQWTEHPSVALDVMFALNDRYALDGRDPNSSSGIMWVLGRFDRGWPERPIFGKVRSMTSASARRKLSLDAYLARWGEEPGP